MNALPAALRAAVFRLLRKYSVRENVTIGTKVHIGPGTVLWAPHAMRVDDGVYIGKRCTIEVDGSIGRGSLIANNVGLVGRRDHDMHDVGSPIRWAPWVGDSSNAPQTGAVEVGPDVWIGYGAIVLAPCVIGRGAIVAAGTVVTRDVAAYSIVAGNPGRRIGQRFNEQQQLEHEDLLHSHWDIRPGCSEV